MSATASSATGSSPPSASTGIDGLDHILSGGLTRNRLYLIEGAPGSGKTTLGFQFLREGARRGEQGLYIALSETEEETRAVAVSHGWSLDGIFMRELVPTEEALEPAEQYTMFHPSEVELTEATKRILTDVDEIKPVRIVLDSLSEFQLLAGNPLRYRRQMLALKHFFASRGCTVVLLDDLTTMDRNLQVQSIAHGVIRLEQLTPDYGSHRRRLRVEKYRGVNFRGGYHDYIIVRGGLEVFPRLVAAEHRQVSVDDRLPSGLAELDRLVGGGLERGTSTLIVGAPGTGKSTLSAQFAASAAERGLHAALFIFDESENTLLSRCAALGIDLRGKIAKGAITVQRIDPAELSPGEFAHAIRRAVEEKDAAVVVIDSLNGYLNAMPAERYMITQLHEILSYLGQKHVVSILVGAHHGIIGNQMQAPVDASYLADAIILLRYYEAKAEVRQAISVIKKRGSNHERTIRDFRLQDGQIKVGEPLRGLRGVLTGVPVEEDAGRPAARAARAQVMAQSEGRVLVLAPTGRDATLTRSVLEHAGIECEICSDLGCVVRELEQGAAALLLAEEAVAQGGGPLTGFIARQPPWSDFPILVLARHGSDADALAKAVGALGNVILLERPIRVAALTGAVRSALRARERQYRARAHLTERDRATRALEEADRRKDEFLATLAHELRNPLAPIRNSVHILRLTASSDAAPPLLEIMERQVGYMVRLIDDLLEVSRITRGKIELRTERVELSAIIQAAVETTRPLVESGRHELTISLPPEPLFLQADAIRLAQVFANLLNNAAKYTDRGGRIWITGASENDRAVVTVKDTGVGIPAASLPRVFDMFMQGDATKGRGGGGLGIGLTLARTLTEMHGGTLDARSEGLGKGSEFVVRLPLTSDSHTLAPELTGALPGRAQSRSRVLVVDDNRDGADSLRELLEVLGAEVRVEYSGPAALTAFVAFQPEMVLLDIGMPGMDGFEVARRLRQRPDSRKVRLVALTGWGQEKDRRSSIAAGFDHHLVKPVSMDTLQSLLAAVPDPA